MQVTPLEGPRGRLRGRVVGEVPRSAECIIVARVRGYIVYLPARRLNRWTDPTRIYVCEDGSLWRAAHAPTVGVVAELVREFEDHGVTQGGR